MKRRILGALGALVVVAVAVWFLWLRDRGEATRPPANDARSAAVKPPPPKPAATTPAAAPRGAAPRWALDADREGPLRLEGQVVGPDGAGVAGVQVKLGSVPPRTATTEDDGTFAFDKLTGRTYHLVASTGQLVGGPVSYRLTPTSDPVVIRLSEGATVIVSVLDDTGRPLGDAEVRDGDDRAARTDAQGKATLAPVRPGFVGVVARATGYAPTSGFTTIGSAGATGQLTITLRKGFAVSGRVVDDAGRPVAKAKVRAIAGMWGFAGASGDEVESDAKGEFTIPALAAGSHTLSAIDGEHAPARSAPVTVSDRPVTGIVITMQAGARIAGVVVAADGKRPVPYATVRIAPKAQDAWGGDTRQTTADEAGRFELRGVARTAMQLRAEAEAAASKLIDVDLTERAEHADLKVVLDVTGRIAGVVVDETGAPVPEVQVNAFPDLLGGASGEGLALAGMSSATTDGDGAFVIHGLPDGAYRLWAARGSSQLREWGQSGTAAKTGDTGVKITLPAPGELVGTIAIAGASEPPRIATVQLGMQAPTPADRGAFVIKDVTPGTYDVTFRGAEFAELIQHDVKIEPGKRTDLGTVTVHRGRRLSGRVVDKRGQPVAGAKIKLGDMLFSGEGDSAQMESFEELAGIRSTISDQAGEFTLIGVPAKRTTVMAEHPERGRSIAATVPEGTDDPPPLTLTLRGFGSIVGKVTMKGQPQARVTITASAKGGGAAASFAQTDDTGAFTMARVPEGPQVLQAIKQQMMSMKSTTVNVQVTAGKQTAVAIDIPVGELTLAVQIKPLPGQQVDSAQVFLFAGMVAVASAKQLNEGFFQGGAQGMKFWFGKDTPMPEFTELVAGEYSVCALPITGSLADPTFQRRLQEHMDALKVYCKQVKLTPSPAKQTVVHELPAMAPLPAPAN